MTYRDRLLKIIKSDGPTSFDGLRLVTLENFFIGNNDIGSIGCNLDHHPGIDFFFARLREIKSQPGVDDLLLAITDTNENDPDPNMWPFSDRVYVFTKMPIQSIEEWFAPLQPTSVTEELLNDRDASDPTLTNEQKAYCAWWD